MIIFADFKLKKLFVFDESGKFKYSCGAVGYSESEHTELYDFSIDKETSTISILDEKGIATYDANNGKFWNIWIGISRHIAQGLATGQGNRKILA